HRAVALVEVVHREVDAAQLAAGHLELAWHARADRDDQRVVLRAKAPRGHRFSDLGTAAEAHALGGEQVDAAVDDPLVELAVGNAEAQQPAWCLVTFVDRDAVAVAIELGGGSQAGGPGAEHRDAPPGAASGRPRSHPALLERAVRDRELDVLDHHRVVVDGDHACRLARRRADAPGELGEVVGRQELVDRLAPAVAVDEVVPLRDVVAERTCVMTERHAAVHAPRTLRAELVRRQALEDLRVVAHALTWVAFGNCDPSNPEEAAKLSHLASRLTRSRASTVLRFWRTSTRRPNAASRKPETSGAAAARQL